LRQSPAIRYFKMQEAARLSGQFRHMSEYQRNAKLVALARVLNRHPRLMCSIGFELAAFGDKWDLPKPRNEPFFFGRFRQS
jgi:hypothetical protein